jgi:hypothetical protein
VVATPVVHDVLAAAVLGWQASTAIKGVVRSCTTAFLHAGVATAIAAVLAGLGIAVLLALIATVLNALVSSVLRGLIAARLIPLVAAVRLALIGAVLIPLISAPTILRKGEATRAERKCRDCGKDYSGLHVGTPDERYMFTLGASGSCRRSASACVRRRTESRQRRSCCDQSAQQE